MAVDIEIKADCATGIELEISPLIASGDPDLAAGLGDYWPPGAIVAWTVADESIGWVSLPRLTVRAQSDALGKTVFFPRSPGQTSVGARVSLKDGRTFNAVALVTVLPGPKMPGPDIVGAVVGHK